MIFILDETDLSSHVDLSNYKVTPRRVSGPAQGTLTNGDHVADVVSIKRDVTLSLDPANVTVTSTLASACMKEYVNLVFTDPISGGTYTGTYEPQIGDIPLAIDSDIKGRRFWNGFQVQFKEK